MRVKDAKTRPKPSGASADKQKRAGGTCRAARDAGMQWVPLHFFFFWVTIKGTVARGFLEHLDVLSSLYFHLGAGERLGETGVVVV